MSSERADLKPKRNDFSLDRADLKFERERGGRDRQTNGQTNKGFPLLPRGFDLGFRAWDLSLEARIHASRLRFRPQAGIKALWLGIRPSCHGLHAWAANSSFGLTNDIYNENSETGFFIIFHLNHKNFKNWLNSE